MTDRDEPDRERMRRDEDTYFAVKEPPKAFAQVGAAVMRKAKARAKPRRLRKPVGAKP
jgi:hypothetical protein